jgi:hypothetical protein
MIPELFIPIWGIPSISLEFTVVTAIRLPKWVSQELRSFLIRFHIFASPRSNFLIFLNPLCRNMHPLLFWFFKSVTTIHRMVDVILLQGAILLWQSFGRHQFHRLGRKYVWYYICPSLHKYVLGYFWCSILAPVTSSWDILCLYYIWSSLLEYVLGSVLMFSSFSNKLLEYKIWCILISESDVPSIMLLWRCKILLSVRENLEVNWTADTECD